MNLGVYINCRNEDLFIRPCINAVKKVFPEVKVLDTGSTDDSVKFARKLKVPVYSEEVQGTEYSEFRNQFLKLHDWVFFIDADEIYPENSLLQLRDKIYNGNHKYCKTYNALWKLIKFDQGKLWMTSHNFELCHPSVTFRADRYYYSRPWPTEVLRRKVGARKGLREPRLGTDQNVWCWHLTLLNRSSEPEPRWRKKARWHSFHEYSEKFNWDPINRLPINLDPKVLKIEKWNL